MGRAAIGRVVFDSAALSPQDRWPQFRRAVAATHQVERLPGDDRPFAARLEAWSLGDVTVVEGRQPGLVYARPAAQIAIDRLDSYAFMLLRSGAWTGEAGARPLSSHAGEVVAFDRRSTVQAQTTDNSVVIMAVARQTLQARLSNEPDLHGRILSGPSGRMFADALSALPQELSAMSAAEALAVADALVGLAAASVANLPALIDGHFLDVRGRAMQMVNDLLQDPNLTPLRLARDLGVSRATLYRALSSAGGPQAYIRRRRLEAIHGLLNDPSEHRSIGELAYSFGFQNAAHFSTAFRAHFGFRPGDARRLLARSGPERPEGEAGQTYCAWTARLSGSLA